MVVVAAELARDVVVLARLPAAAVVLRELALLRAAATTWLRRVLAALLVAVPLVVLPAAVARVVRLVLLEVVPRVQPVELLSSPSFSAATARTTR